MKKKIIPVFYASDEKYIPYLAVALQSLKTHRKEEYEYHVHILHTGKRSVGAKKVRSMEEENLRIYFDDVSEKLARIEEFTHCRDYYTNAIYYRLFIPELFPQYDKAVYLDCDTVLLDDVAKLYEEEIGNNYIGAVADQVVAATEVFRLYTKNALGIEARKYFNSGVIVMNLKELRKINFFKTFCNILSSYDFTIAPDQDCLNLICKDRVHYYDANWNKMPLGQTTVGKPKLIHYNLSMKPWHYDGLLYENYFWQYAEKTEFLETIKTAKAAFTETDAEKDRIASEKLLALAKAEAKNPNNYIRSVGRYNNENGVGMYGFIENFRTAFGGFATHRKV